MRMGEPVKPVRNLEGAILRIDLAYTGAGAVKATGNPVGNLPRDLELDGTAVLLEADELKMLALYMDKGVNSDGGMRRQGLREDGGVGTRRQGLEGEETVTVKGEDKGFEVEETVMVKRRCKKLEKKEVSKRCKLTPASLGHSSQAPPLIFSFVFLNDSNSSFSVTRRRPGPLKSIVPTSSGTKTARVKMLLSECRGSLPVACV